MGDVIAGFVLTSIIGGSIIYIIKMIFDEGTYNGN